MTVMEEVSRLTDPLEQEAWHGMPCRAMGSTGGEGVRGKTWASFSVVSMGKGRQGRVNRLASLHNHSRLWGRGLLSGTWPWSD